jgi:Glyoxalase/Bleomycin resistance protein/Dioxygenase superfamily
MIKLPDAIQPIGAALRRDSCAHLPRPRRGSRLAVKGFWVQHPSPHRRSSHPDESRHGCITIAEGNVAPNDSHIVQVRIEDARGHCERSRKNGAIILTEPQDQPYGERQYNAQDFCGHRWDFTETISDVAPEEWSGGAFHLE